MSANANQNKSKRQRQGRKDERRIWRDASSQQPLLVRPETIGAYYEAYDDEFEYDNHGRRQPPKAENGVLIIRIQGPLEHHGDSWWSWFETYDRIYKRACEALERPDVSAIVLKIDSPGGVANGMSATSRALRSLADRQGKLIYAYADEQICSAAYGLACSADEIWIPPTGEVGSIGVILPVLDLTEAYRKDGIKYELLVTGDRKADGHPAQGINKEAIKALQARVDAIGNDFFALVAESRGVKPEAVRSLEAGIFSGEAAVKAKLADGVASWGDFYASVVDSVKPVNVNSTQKKNARAGARASQKRLTMRNKNLSLAKAKTKMQAELAEALKIEDPVKRAEAVNEITARGFDAASTYKKTVKVEKTDDDSGDDETKEDDDKEDDAESEDESEEDESEDESDDAESEDESEEDESEDETDKKESKSKNAKSKTSGRLANHVARVTGTSDHAEQMGRLDAMAAAFAAYPKLSADVAKMKSVTRLTQVNALIESAIRDKKILRSSAEYIATLRATGMRSPKRLRAQFAVMPKMPFRTVDDGALREANDKRSGANLSDADLLTDVAMTIIRANASISGITEEKSKEHYLKAAREAAGVRH